MLPIKPYFKDIGKLKVKEWKKHVMLPKKSWSVTLTSDKINLRIRSIISN